MKLADTRCDACGRKLVMSGAILWGVPEQIIHQTERTRWPVRTMCRKTHLCQSCAAIIQSWIANYKQVSKIIQQHEEKKK